MVANVVNAKLTAEVVTETAARMVVRYKLENHSDEYLCVLNRLYRTDLTGKRHIEPDLAFVIFEGNDTIHITRSFIPVAAGLKVEYVDIPYITILGPRKTLTEQAVIELPAREYYPYMKDITNSGKERDRTRIYLSLGIFVKTPDIVLRRPKDTHEGIFSATLSDVSSRQILIKSNTIQLKIRTLGGH